VRSSGVIGLVLVIAALGVALLPEREKPGPMRDMETPHSTLPRIEAQLGDSFQAIKGNSTYDFSQTPFLGGGTIIEAPLAFVLNHPQRGFELPYAKYVAISFEDESKTIAVAIGLAPHRGTLSLSEFWEQLKTLVETFDRAGWQRDPLYSDENFSDKSYAEFETEFVDAARPFRIGQRASIAFWRNDRQLLRVSIVKVYEKGERYSKAMGATQDRFNLIVDIERDLARK